MVKKITGIILVLFCICVASNMVFSAGSKEASSSKVSATASKGGLLSFNLKDADIKSVLQIFAKQLGKNIVAGDGITGKISLSFSNVKPQEGLESVLRAKGYDWYLEGDTIVISNQKVVRTYLLQYANAAEIKGALELLMSKDDQVSVNDSYNALIVKTSSENIGRIEKAIRNMDIPPVQVMVEAKIIELKVGDVGTAGLDMKVNYQKNPNVNIQTKNFAGKASDATAQGVYAQVITGNIESFLSALQTQTGYDLVASPKIATLNHKTATILIGSKLGYRTSVITQTSTTQQINFLETGTRLTLTPHVSDDGFIRMTIYPKISEGYVTDDLPTENTTETQNEVLVKSGQTIVIGGLTKNAQTQTDSGIPILMDIPFIGTLFRKTSINNEKRELIVVITPTIMTPEYLQTMQNDLDSMNKKAKDNGASLIH